jgi:hypothetical protein
MILKQSSKISVEICFISFAKSFAMLEKNPINNILQIFLRLALTSGIHPKRTPGG